MALGQHLRADQQGGAFGLDCGVALLEIAARARAVAVEAQDARVGKACGEVLLQALRTDTERQQAVAAAGWALPGQRGLVAAVMAAQHALRAVHGQTRVAARAFAVPAAVMAEQGGRIAAPVAEHECLLAAFEGLAQRRERGLGQAVVQALAAQVDDLHARRFGASGTPGQLEAAVAARGDVGEALQRRRGRTQHHRHAQRARADDREIARVVAPAVLLLVRAVVFLVDDDQSRMCQWGEYRRARAEHHRRLAARGGEPGLRACAIGQARMQHRDRHAEALAVATHGLRCETDFRHQHQGLPTARDARADRAEIDLGLAGAGDAVEQEGGVAACRGIDRGDGGGLLRVQRRPDQGRRGRQARGHDLDQACVQGFVDQRARARDLLGDLGGRAWPGREQGEQAQQALATAIGRRIRRALAGGGDEVMAPARHRWWHGPPQRCRQCGLDHFTERMRVVGRGPVQRVEQFPT